MISLNREYELEYWKKTSKEKILSRYPIASDYLNIPAYLENAETVIDLGCGAYGGIFTYHKYKTMIGIDPLWMDYFKLDMCPSFEINHIIGTSDNFNCDVCADAVVCINAIDHSGNLCDAANEIFTHIKDGGYFLLHTHMRTLSQLNAGHKMPLTEDMVLREFDKYELCAKTVLTECPMDKKPYKTMFAVWRK